MKNNIGMAMINMDMYTVEIFKTMEDLKDIISRFGDDVGELQNVLIISEDDMPKTIDTNKISIVCYYDEVTNILHDELSFNEYQTIKAQSTKKKQELLSGINIDVHHIQYILSCGGWCFEVEDYLLANGYDKKIFNRFGNTEISYVKNGIHIEIVNDLEVVFYSGFMKLLTIEKRNNLVLVHY